MTIPALGLVLLSAGPAAAEQPAPAVPSASDYTRALLKAKKRAKKE
jgi:hypothetical protein